MLNGWCMAGSGRSFKHLIRAPYNFKMGIISAMGAILVVYLVDFVLMLLGMRVGFVHDGGIVGILFSLFVVTIAAFSFVLDFDFIESSLEHHSPKYMEWYLAFGLVVTLVWLYMEILRLLSKLREFSP